MLAVEGRFGEDIGASEAALLGFEVAGWTVDVKR